MSPIKFKIAPCDDKHSVCERGSINAHFGNQTQHTDLGVNTKKQLIRSTAPRLALSQLSATGVLAALVALLETNKEAAFSCAVAAAVNFVASAHYYYILKHRSKASDEMAVDALRCAAVGLNM